MMQVNLNRSFEAYGILLRYIKKFDYDIVFATEMPRKPKLSGWYSNDLKTSFIYVDSNKLRPAPQVVCKSNFVIAVKIGKLYVASVYISPNCERRDFDNLILDLDNVYNLSEGRNLLLTGDFNARSIEWDIKTNWRGKLLYNWCLDKNMNILNNLDFTCNRYQGSSVVDLTMCTDDVTECVFEWKVLKEEENLSDHDWISWKFKFKRNYKVKRNKYDYIRWKSSKLNVDLFENILEWLPVDENLDPDRMSKRLETVMYDACSVSMGRSYMPGLKDKQVYWWNDIIEHERQKSRLDKIRTHNLISLDDY
ncbi:uncharacterized protein [Cardiocondyla obscurior]|uniref:uncharacterized protein n=1 Tax=Cardiocondyla obscurior TaxID=286306 RepID=UPI0039657FF2